jgi:hypothetical protein
MGANAFQTSRAVHWHGRYDHGKLGDIGRFGGRTAPRDRNGEQSASTRQGTAPGQGRPSRGVPLARSRRAHAWHRRRARWRDGNGARRRGRRQPLDSVVAQRHPREVEACVGLDLGAIRLDSTKGWPPVTWRRGTLTWRRQGRWRGLHVGIDQNEQSIVDDRRGAPRNEPASPSNFIDFVNLVDQRIRRRFRQTQGSDAGPR